MQLSELTVDSAKGLEGTVFTVALPEGGSTSLKLDEAAAIEIRQRRRRTTTGRQPFSLFFLGDAAMVLPQGMYRLESEAATFENLFLVPIGRDDEATEYEAVFT